MQDCQAELLGHGLEAIGCLFDIIILHCIHYFLSLHVILKLPTCLFILLGTKYDRFALLPTLQTPTLGPQLMKLLLLIATMNA